MARNFIDILDDMDNVINNPFSDSEDIIMRSKAKAMDEKLGLEVIDRFMDKTRNNSDSDYWISLNGVIKITEMDTNHLACIPRHQIKNGVAKDKNGCNQKVINELEKRGCVIKDNGFVIQP